MFINLLSARDDSGGRNDLPSGWGRGEPLPWNSWKGWNIHSSDTSVTQWNSKEPEEAARGRNEGLLRAEQFCELNASTALPPQGCVGLELLSVPLH